MMMDEGCHIANSDETANNLQETDSNLKTFLYKCCDNTKILKIKCKSLIISM